MRPLRLVLGAGVALALISAAAAPMAAAQAQTKSTREPAPAPSSMEVDPAAMAALTRMGAYLATLTTFDITAKTSLDLVTHDDQKVKLDGVNRYIVRKPDAFFVEVATDWRVRQLTYDGKLLTLFAPELGFYASVAAPGTIKATLDAAEAQYGVAIPLHDLFVWADPSQNTRPAPTTAIVIGAAKVNGVDTDHYAFREPEVDWQIWIQRGDKPVPLKVVITDKAEAVMPQYEAVLTWNTPQITADTFTFKPVPGAMPIRLANLKIQ